MSSPGITAAVTASVPSSATNVTVFPTMGSGNGRTVWNDSTATLYLKFGPNASTSSYTVQLAAGAFYEFPLPLYTGQVDGVWASASGFARITWW